MWTITAAFREALTASHRVVARADVINTDTIIAQLDVVSGQVAVANDSAIRRRCSLRLADPDGTLIPAATSDLLHPSSGNELRLWRGIALADGDELVPVGTFRVAKPVVEDRRDGWTVTVEGYDRARKVQRARFTDLYRVTSGANYATAIKDVIDSRYPGLEYNFMSTTRVAPALTFEAGDDPWEAAQKMADALGAELFFDQMGTVVLRPQPDPNVDESVWTYEEGADATVLGFEKNLDDERTYNRVIVIGESTENAAPVRAEAKDDNPASPTYYLGPYGDVPYFYVSQYITSVAQAQETADAFLRRVLGVAETVQFTAVVNAAHDVGDVVRIVRPRLKVDATYVLDALTVPLGHDAAMTAETRKRLT